MEIVFCEGCEKSIPAHLAPRSRQSNGTYLCDSCAPEAQVAATKPSTNGWTIAALVLLIGGIAGFGFVIMLGGEKPDSAPTPTAAVQPDTAPHRTGREPGPGSPARSGPAPEHEPDPAPEPETQNDERERAPDVRPMHSDQCLGGVDTACAMPS